MVNIPCLKSGLIWIFRVHRKPDVALSTLVMIFITVVDIRHSAHSIRYYQSGICFRPSPTVSQRLVLDRMDSRVFYCDIWLVSEVIPDFATRINH